MKGILKSDNKKFKPVTLTIKIETERDLDLFLTLFNASPNEVCKFLNANIPYEYIPEFNAKEVTARSLYTIWEELDNLRDKYNQ